MCRRTLQHPATAAHNASLRGTTQYSACSVLPHTARRVPAVAQKIDDAWRRVTLRSPYITGHLVAKHGLEKTGADIFERGRRAVVYYDCDPASQQLVAEYFRQAHKWLAHQLGNEMRLKCACRSTSRVFLPPFNGVRITMHALTSAQLPMFVLRPCIPRPGATAVCYPKTRHLGQLGDTDSGVASTGRGRRSTSCETASRQMRSACSTASSPPTAIRCANELPATTPRRPRQQLHGSFRGVGDGPHRSVLL